MTQAPAERFKLDGKGVVAEGMDADLVVFDLGEVEDNATYASRSPRRRGSCTCWSTASSAIRDNVATGARPGGSSPRLDDLVDARLGLALGELLELRRASPRARDCRASPGTPRRSPTSP